MTSPGPIIRRAGRRTVEILLWCGAGLGALSILTAFAAVIFGMVPLVFTSGSMSPEVPTGSLGLARTVAASELRVGDVVSVTAANETRVTHRIVATEQQSDLVVLTLKGDTNPSPDQESYPVKEADRVFFTAPYLGRAIMILTSPWGMFLGGLAAAALLFWAFRRQPPSVAGSDPEDDTPQPKAKPPAKSSRSRVDHAKACTSATLLAVGIPALLLVTGNSGTAASFTDTATVNTEGFAAHRVLQPGPVTCSVDTNKTKITVTTTPTDLRYTYWARAYNPAGAGVSGYKQLTTTGGNLPKAEFFASDFPTLAKEKTYTFRIHSRVGASVPTGVDGWESETFRRAHFGLDQQSQLVCGEAIVPPIVVFTQPLNGFDGTKSELQALINRDCGGHGSTDPAVCGTVTISDSPGNTLQSLQYTIQRSGFFGTYCWTPGGAAAGYPWGGCNVYRDVARNGNKWSIPGFIYPGSTAWNYTITVKAEDSRGAITETAISFRVRP